MKRLMLLGVCVALCSFSIVQWLLQKTQEQPTIIVTFEQEEWLKQKFAAEDKVNEAQKKVMFLEEKYDRILDERKNVPHWSAADARAIVQEIEKSKKFAQSKNCKEPTEYLKDYCFAYEQAQADREWWGRLTMVAVKLNAARQELIEAKISANQIGDALPEVKRQLLKHTGTA